MFGWRDCLGVDIQCGSQVACRNSSCMTLNSCRHFSTVSNTCDETYANRCFSGFQPSRQLVEHAFVKSLVPSTDSAHGVVCSQRSSRQASVTRPVPEPKAREILIQVYATGGTPTEKLWYTTSHCADGSTRSKAISGHEFSGIVAGLAILADEECR
jgi:hypothetical protein